MNAARALLGLAVFLLVLYALSTNRSRINWRLVMAPDPVRRSVVAHEVAHLVHFDHSPAFHALLGIRAGSRITHSITRFWPTARAFIARCLVPRDGLLRAEEEWISRDGERLPVLLSASCQRDETGEPLAILVVALDIRERRKLELELRHWRTQLRQWMTLPPVAGLALR